MKIPQCVECKGKIAAREYFWGRHGGQWCGDCYVNIQKVVIGAWIDKNGQVSLNIPEEFDLQVNGLIHGAGI